MSARIHGLTAFSLVPGPDLYLSRDAEGKTTATRSFTCLKSAVQTAFIQSKIKKGISITALCSDIPPEFSALTVDSSSSRDAPGGMTTIDISFAGYVDEGEFSFDREINYSLRGTTFRRPILEHPTFIKDMEATDESIRRGLVAILTGDAYAAWGTDDEYLYTYTAQQLGLTIVEIVPDAPAIVEPPLPDMSVPPVADAPVAPAPSND